MFTNLPEWDQLKGSGTAELLLELISNDEKVQRIAAEALGYTLVELGGEGLENYGNPELLLNDNRHLLVIPILVQIATANSTNALAKVLALYVLYDIYNFAAHERTGKFSQQANLICQRVVSYLPVYQKLLQNSDPEIQKYAEDLLQLINRD